MHPGKMLCQNDLKRGKKVARGEFKLQIKKTILSGLLWWPMLKHYTAPDLLFFQGVKFPKKGNNNKQAADLLNSLTTG